jgi:hypothetical protein
MRVPVHDQPAAWEASQQARGPPCRGTGIVHEPDAKPFCFDDQLLR